MQKRSDGEITRFFDSFVRGEPQAKARLMELTYRELRKIAAGHLRRERAGHSLQTTDLVHEAYLRLVSQATTSWRDRAQFYQVAAHVMRQVLIDRARRRNARKRGGDVSDISLDKALDLAQTRSADLLALDEALSRLQKLDSRQCQVVELRFFAGLTEEEIAEVLGFSVRTINHDWRMARAWLYKELYR
jgi:RNA polymerase sigma factor (TIGR02999 family)